MKLLINYINIHYIIFLHITLIYTLKPPEINDSGLDPFDHQISEENKKLIIKQVKTNLLKLLGLKEEPKRPSEKAYVPQAMLAEYVKNRDSVRDTIPDDRDFYGKLQLAGLDCNHENFWDTVHNKFGSNDIEVELNKKNEPKKEIVRRHVSGNSNSNSSSNSKQTKRTSQATNQQRSKARRTDKCSKKTLSINFDEVGWSSWIIAPQAYYADYCAGDCTFPMSDSQNATNHAIIQSIYHVVGRVVPRSCCAPTKLGKMAILYQVDGGVQMKHYDDMIVESCGCL